jgi:bifunctional DNA-binding transcriptional regulator/antitoxin component of YhaV-PrlF toxin-antitoxin module
MPKLLTNTVSINSRGQLVLPIQLRKEMNLIGGGKLLFSFDPENRFTILKPMQSKDFVQKWAGIINSEPNSNTKQYLTKNRKAEIAKDLKLKNSK